MLTDEALWPNQRLINFILIFSFDWMYGWCTIKDRMLFFVFFVSAETFRMVKKF